MNEEHLNILKMGVKHWNQWRDENPNIVPDLSEADLSWADLSGANLARADLTGASLTGADLTGVNLTWADLSGANLPRAYLLEANLTRAKLQGTKLKNSYFYRTLISDVDLSMAKGLKTIRHMGPSTIGIDTIYKSKGKIPEIFLLNAGIPENFITYMPSLTGQTLQFYSCFISHSTKDRRFCERIYNDLRGKEIRIWNFPENATMGKSIWEGIDQGIKVYDKLIVICSKSSLQSDPVIREIERALDREDREKKPVLFPICIDKYLYDKWDHERKSEVVAKVVGDFKWWYRSDQKYRKSFRKLLDALINKQA